MLPVGIRPAWHIEQMGQYNFLLLLLLRKTPLALVVLLLIKMLRTHSPDPYSIQRRVLPSEFESRVAGALVSVTLSYMIQGDWRRAYNKPPRTNIHR